MKLNWKSVKAVHVTQACEALLNSAGPKAKLRGLIVTYKDKQLPAKVTRLTDLPTEWSRQREMLGFPSH